MGDVMVRKPLPTGEYAVGTTTFTVYNDRDEILFPGTKRSIPARVYYPSSKDSVKNMKKARYMSENVAGALKKYMHVPVDIDKSDAKGDNCSECYDDAPVTADMKTS